VAWVGDQRNASSWSHYRLSGSESQIAEKKEKSRYVLFYLERSPTSQACAWKRSSGSQGLPAKHVLRPGAAFFQFLIAAHSLLRDFSRLRFILAMLLRRTDGVYP
jgi:hypothetical protein